MGNENSRPDTDGLGVQGVCLSPSPSSPGALTGSSNGMAEAPSPPLPKSQEQSSSPSSRPSSAAKKSPPQRPTTAPVSRNNSPSQPVKGAQDKSPKSWMFNNQTRVALVDKRTPKGRVPGQQSLEAQMQELSAEEAKQQRTFEQKIEESKQELVGKLNNFVQRTGAKHIKATPPARAPVVPPSALPQVAEKTKQSWVAKLVSNKKETLEKLKDKLDKEKLYAPLTQDAVGDEVEKSLGSACETFAGYQGTIHHVVQSGLSNDLLDQFLLDEESERQLTTYEKWSIIRHAAEQVLQVYANRSNARWIEAEQWAQPTVIDANTVAASVYSNAVDSAITAGAIGLLFIDDGRLVETGEHPDDIAPLLTSDLWQAIKELAPHKVPSSQRLERLSVAGRHLLHAAVSVEMWYGAAALKQLKVVVAVDSECEHALVADLQQWSFFGLQHRNVAVLPLPRFHGFAQDVKGGRLAHVKGSPRLMLGTGYAMFLLNSPAEAYTLDESGSEPQCLQGTVLDWLREGRVTWLFSGLFSDCERLRPEALFDGDFLAGALYAADRTGANMAMEVVHGDAERDVRTYDSIVLRRQRDGGEGAAGGGGGSGGGGSGAAGSSRNCNLRASAMRTVRSYQIMQGMVANPHGFYVSTQRYAFKVSALQRLLVDATSFHADVRLHGFYAYALFDMADVTTFPEAHCAAILGQGLHGPAISEVVFGRQWLAQTATVLEMQDRVNEFRQKAIELVKYDRLPSGAGGGGGGGYGAYPSSLSGASSGWSTPKPMLEHSGSSNSRPGTAATSRFRERKSGFQVVLLLTLEHRVVCRSALKLARLFIRNIVDRLHIVLLLSPADNKDNARHLFDELTDKELEFNGQLFRDVVVRQPDVKVADTVSDYCTVLNANLIVVPSLKLCGPAGDLGGTMSSLAFLVARNVTCTPVLVVKNNTAGRYAASNSSNGFQPGQREFLTVMCHLDGSVVTPMVEAMSRCMSPATDTLFLAKTQAYERPGQLSMRSRRVFVQGRMAVGGPVKVEERAYAGAAPQELAKAVEAEQVDLLVVSVAGELPVSKEVEELLKTARTSVYIFRNKEAAAPPQVRNNNLVIVDADSGGGLYGRR